MEINKEKIEKAVIENVTSEILNNSTIGRVISDTFSSELRRYDIAKEVKTQIIIRVDKMIQDEMIQDEMIQDEMIQDEMIQDEFTEKFTPSTLLGTPRHDKRVSLDEMILEELNNFTEQRVDQFGNPIRAANGSTKIEYIAREAARFITSGVLQSAMEQKAKECKEALTYEIAKVIAEKVCKKINNC